MKKLTVLVLGLAMSATAAFAADDGKANSPNLTLSFEAGKSALTSSDKDALKEMVKSVQSHAKIGDIYIAAWSDNPVPRDGEELSKVDRRLANKRIDAVRDYLKRGLSVSKGTSTYNMAERANWLARTLNTPDAELKSGVAKDTIMSKEEFDIIKANGQSSKVVVVIRTKTE